MTKDEMYNKLAEEREAEERLESYDDHVASLKLEALRARTRIACAGYGASVKRTDRLKAKLTTIFLNVAVGIGVCSILSLIALAVIGKI